MGLKSPRTENDKRRFIAERCHPSQGKLELKYTITIKFTKHLNFAWLTEPLPYFNHRGSISSCISEKAFIVDLFIEMDFKLNFPLCPGKSAVAESISNGWCLFTFQMS